MKHVICPNRYWTYGRLSQNECSHRSFLYIDTIGCVNDCDDPNGMSLWPWSFLYAIRLCCHNGKSNQIIIELRSIDGKANSRKYWTLPLDSWFFKLLVEKNLLPCKSTETSLYYTLLSSYNYDNSLLIGWNRNRLLHIFIYKRFWETTDSNW